MTDLQNPIFNDLSKAREALELARWPNGPYCPHCGNSDERKIAKVEGKKQSEPPRDCRRPVYLSYAAMGILSIAA